MKSINLLLIPIFFSLTAVRATDPPNIVLIFTDDQGWNDVGCYGSEIPTPNIDRIAKEGMKFNQFYSASSICTPSRFGLLTGKNPSRSHDRLLSALMFMGDADKGIHSNETTIAEVLRDRRGYETALIGKWHLGHGSPAFLPPNHGFDYFRGHTGGCIDYFTMTYGAIPDWYHGMEHVQQDGYATEVITDEAVHYLKSRQESEKPFFLYLPYNAPHFGKGYSPADQTPVNIMQPQAADLVRVSAIKDKIRREFAAMTVNLDDGIGKVLDVLDQTGLSKNTLVIFITDHGGDPVYGGSNEPLRGVKASLFEGGIRVPTLMRWPGKITPGTTSDAVAWTIDLFPTFCALAGIDISRNSMEGIELIQITQGKEPTSDRELFWELSAHTELARKPWAALRQGWWKYLNSPLEGEFLFDLQTDPYEKNNLSTVQKQRLEKMRKRWEELAIAYQQ